ncbi:MAG: hypothetical protein HOW73_12695 [Polyangiaceae bacterium]|nr:hypothetical protein [Polyangiaceae bacterium]
MSLRPHSAVVYAIVAAGCLSCTLDFDEVGPRGAAGGGGDSQGGNGPGGGNATAGGGPNTGGDDTGGGPVGGAPPCGTTDVCVQLGGGVFSGPFQIEAEPCAGTTVIVGGADLGDNSVVADPATCQCSCIAPTNLGCPAPVATPYTDAACMVGNGSVGVGLPEDACSVLPQNTHSLYFQLGGFGSPTNNCTSDAVPAFVPPPSFTQQLYGCNVAIGTCEDGGACFPSKTCVFSDTETVCPEGMEQVASIVRPTDLKDDRGCTCECGPPAGPCQFAIGTYSDGSCAAFQPADNDSGCVYADNSGVIASAIYSPAASGGCFTGQSPSGSVAIAQRPLVCCTP